MSNSEWASVRALFLAALDHPPSERAGFVAERAGDDSALAREVLDLLAEDAATVQEPTPEPTASVDPPRSWEGARLGPYRLVGRLGEGGMGSVYLAERVDGLFEREVALKLIRSPAASDELQRRFAAERRVLAALNHPNIATLFDAGAADDGTPYIAMELVDGLTLDQFVATESPPTDSRLGLFLAIADAVQYAHKHLVVHRDLKPSNVMVGAAGQVKLLDFGIARLLPESPLAGDGPATQTHLQRLTPEYASPEQLRGEPATTLSDVYQLGLILYELLSGHHPFRTAGRSPLEVAVAAAQEEPPPPSAVVGTGNRMLRKQLAGDLDRIALKALERSPERRYQSADRLADDIRRHLAGLPVLARRQSIGYRLSRFVRRRRALSAAVVAGAATLAIGIGATLWQARIAERERAAAVAAARRAGTVTGFLTEILTSADPTQMGPDVSLLEVLEIARQRSGAELAGQPDVESAVRSALGASYRSLGAWDEAVEQLEIALRLARSAHGERSPETAAAWVQLAEALDDAGETSRAEESYTTALGIFAENPGVASSGLLAAHNGYGVLLSASSRPVLAREHLETALGISREIEPGGSLETAMVLNNLGVLLQRLGRRDDAEQRYRESVDITERLRGPDYPALTHPLSNLAAILADGGDLAAAVELYRRISTLRAESLGAEHPQTTASLTELAATLHEAGENAEAERTARSSLAIQRRTLSPSHPLVARSMLVLGSVLVDLGSLDEARPLLEDAFTIRRDGLGEEHRLTASARAELGRCLALSGERDAGLEAMRTARRQMAAALGPDHPSLSRLDLAIASIEAGEEL